MGQMTGLSKCLIAVFVLSALFVGGGVWWSWPWWVVILLGLFAVGGGLGLFAAVVMGRAQDSDGAIIFVTCPGCGTRNPRCNDGRYECYHCGRDFSELSGRHPVLPGSVSGRDS